MKNLLLISTILVWLLMGLGPVDAQDMMTEGIYDDSQLDYIYYSGGQITHNTGATGYYNETYSTLNYGYFHFEGTGYIVYGRKYPLAPANGEYFAYSSDFPDFYFQDVFDLHTQGQDIVTELFSVHNLTFGHWEGDFSPYGNGDNDSFLTLDYVQILGEVPSATIDLDLSPFFDSLQTFLPMFLGIFAIVAAIYAAMVLARNIMNAVIRAFSGGNIN